MFKLCKHFAGILMMETKNSHRHLGTIIIEILLYRSAFVKHQIHYRFDT